MTQQYKNILAVGFVSIDNAGQGSRHDGAGL